MIPRLGVFTLSSVSPWGITLSQFLVHLYAEVPIALICRHTCLALNSHSLLLGFVWSSCKQALIGSRRITILFYSEGESLEFRPSTYKRACGGLTVLLEGRHRNYARYFFSIESNLYRFPSFINLSQRGGDKNIVLVEKKISTNILI